MLTNEVSSFEQLGPDLSHDKLYHVKIFMRRMIGKA